MFNKQVLFVVGIFAAFMSGAFISSPELRILAAATIGSAEIIDNSIQSTDINDITVNEIPARSTK